MKHEEIQEAAKEAEFDVNGSYIAWEGVLCTEELTRFAAIIEKRTIERCAVVCEQMVDRPAGYMGVWEGYGQCKSEMTGTECAAAIRKLGEQ